MEAGADHHRTRRSGRQIESRNRSFAADHTHRKGFQNLPARRRGVHLVDLRVDDHGRSALHQTQLAGELGAHRRDLWSGGTLWLSGEISGGHRPSPVISVSLRSAQIAEARGVPYDNHLVFIALHSAYDPAGLW